MSEGTLANFQFQALLKAGLKGSKIGPSCSGHYPVRVFKKVTLFCFFFSPRHNLPSLVNCLTALTLKTLFLLSSFNSYSFNLCPLSPVLQPYSPVHSLVHVLGISSKVMAGSCETHPKPSLLQTK